MADLLVIVPTRGRPGNIRRALQAWDHTQAWADADILLAIDADDPTVGGYREIGVEWAASGQVWLMEFPEWAHMVAKLNAAAADVLGEYTAVAFMGDDHVPRTVGWAHAYLDTLAELGTGVVFGDDLHRGAELCSQWAMTADIVRALGRMIPADVEHLYSDTSVMDVAREAGCLRYLPDVVVEHVHYIVGKATQDAGYIRVNSIGQYARDGASYEAWKANQMAADVATVRALRGQVPA